MYQGRIQGRGTGGAQPFLWRLCTPILCPTLWCAPPQHGLGAPKRHIIKYWFQVEVGMEKILLLNI